MCTCCIAVEDAVDALARSLALRLFLTASGTVHASANRCRFWVEIRVLKYPSAGALLYMQRVHTCPSRVEAQRLRRSPSRQPASQPVPPPPPPLPPPPTHRRPLPSTPARPDSREQAKEPPRPIPAIAPQTGHPGKRYSKNKK